MQSDDDTMLSNERIDQAVSQSASAPSLFPEPICDGLFLNPRSVLPDSPLPSFQDTLETTNTIHLKSVDASVQTEEPVTCVDAGCQYTVTTSEQSAQTLPEIMPEEVIVSETDDEEMMEKESDHEDWTCNISGSDTDSFCPSTENSDFIEDEKAGEQSTPKNEIKFIVFESCLRELLRRCRVCSGVCDVIIITEGSAAIVTCKCLDCMHTSQWSTQPKVRQIYVGNLLMSAAILFSGALSSKIFRFLDIIGLSRIAASTHFRHQKKYLHTTVHAVWNAEQTDILQGLKDAGKKLILAGDGRCDSPGHCAKYGGYNMLECTIKKVVDVEVVQSNEVTSSNACELEGLKRSLEFLTSKGFQIETLITDRHLSVAKELRVNHQNIKYLVQSFLISRATHEASLGKKLDALAAKKGFDQVGKWRKSITNHLYWCAASTSVGEGDNLGSIMLAKWNSLPNHIINLHRHQNSFFSVCEHDEMNVDASHESDWFNPASEVYIRLTDIIEDKYLLKDVQKLSPLHQTSSLEAFHSVILTFAPKHTAFFYLGMRSRLMLAALHYNENASKEAAKDVAGNIKYSIIFPKAKKGDYSLQKRHHQPTYGYTKRLTAYLLTQYANGPADLEQSLWNFVPFVPDCLAAEKQRPNLDEALAGRVTRLAQ